MVRPLKKVKLLKMAIFKLHYQAENLHAQRSMLTRTVVVYHDSRLKRTRWEAIRWNVLLDAFNSREEFDGLHFSRWAHVFEAS